MKYKFKNAEVEKALRLVAKEVGITDESFDKQIEEWAFASLIYMDDGEHDVLCFSTDLIEEIEEFDPDCWNNSNVEPPKDEYFKKNSPFMLVEDSEGIPHKAFFDFDKNAWTDVNTMSEISCERFRSYPAD